MSKYKKVNEDIDTIITKVFKSVRQQKVKS